MPSNTYEMQGVERPPKKNNNCTYWEQQTMKLKFGEENKKEYNLKRSSKSQNESSKYGGGTRSGK